MTDLSPSIDPGRLTERLVDIVKLPSENPPGDEKAAADLVAGWLDDLGLRTRMVEVEPGRPSVVARWEGTEGPRLAYCSHLDVVPAGDPSLWDHDPYGAHIEGGRLHGRGACDAKGPLVAALEAVAALRSSGFTPAGVLELALVVDEEAMGFKGAAHLVEEGIVTADVAIVGEPTSLRVVRAQRGASWFRVITRGVAGHGSAPERGVNAVQHMAEIVTRLPATIPDIAHPLLGGPTLNVGTIRGGEKVNIIPASCIVEVDRRTIPGESPDDVVAGLQSAIDGAKSVFPTIDASIELAFYAEPFEILPTARVVEVASTAVQQQTGKPASVIGFRGASDARFFAQKGADVIVWGPGDISLAHTAHESIDLSELEVGARAYAAAFATILSS
ncbi:MAG TPA: M20 family metallopeptidase [Actinomycetota bacterium]|nr:M20 family metallopeptidase [Actinomycetota bacterium]